MNVLVTGATGALGPHVVMQLRNAGHRARIFSRNPQGHVDAVQGDLITGAGLLKAVTGMDAIIHAASAAAQP
ncbi:MAG TPA: NAD-dependent epimerase/dehydratase family protein, partial [Candidatus Dormibacteraeota bacterium]